MKNLSKLRNIKSSTESTSGTPRVIISNSFCKLENPPKEIIDKIRDRLTYENKEEKFNKFQILKSLKFAHFAKRNGSLSPWIIKKLEELQTDINGYIEHLKEELSKCESNQRVCLLKKDLSFPTGLWPLVQGLDARIASFEVLDRRVEPKAKVRYKWKIEPFEPRYYQEEMLQEASIHERGVFAACVGSGKTLIMANIVHSRRVNTLIVLPSSALLDQTKNAFEAWFGKSFVQHVSTADVKAGRKLKPIRLCTIQTLASLQKNGILSKVVKDIDMIMYDEIHHSGSSSFVNLLPEISHIYYRYGFSGSFLRNDSKTLDMWGVLSNVLYEYPASRAIQDGYITPVEFRIKSLQGVAKRVYHSEYEANFCGSQSILLEIKRILAGIKEGKQVLILVKQKSKAGDIIHKFLKKNGIENSYVSGDDKKEKISDTIKKFNEKKIQILIGSKVIGEGIDIHSTEELILATGGKSEIEITQAIGRAVRLSPGKKKAIVYDFDFVDTKFMYKHTQERIRIYEEQFAGEVNYE